MTVMYYICLFTQDNRKAIIPSPFAEEETAWMGIQELMQQKDHPKLAWIRKVEIPNGTDNLS